MIMENKNSNLAVSHVESANEVFLEPLTLERTIELEELLGKALLNRFQKEIAFSNLNSENI